MDRKSYTEYVSKSGRMSITSLKMRTGGKRIRFTFLSVHDQREEQYGYDPRETFDMHPAMEEIEARHRAEIEKPKLSKREV